MAATILTDFGSSERVARVMESGAFVAEDMEVPLAEIGVDMMRATEQMFMSGGRRGGGSWKKLKEDTVRRKGNALILRGTEDERLFKSLTQVGNPDLIMDFGSTSIEYGTDVEYAGVHQSGAPKRNIPKRPFLRFTKRDMDRWEDIIVRHLMKPFRTTSAAE